ncbi:MAG: hypothetical protein WBC17_14235 [Mycobacterium sp.]
MSDTLNPRYGTIDQHYALALAGTSPDNDGPVWMVNLMKYREVADYADYADGQVSTISGREADDRYAPVEILGDIGAAPVFFGDVEQQLLGAPTWDRVAVVKYPTRRSFIDMQSRPDFHEAHQHKDAGMAETIVMGCVPLPQPTTPPGVVFPDWENVEHPSTAEDGPITVVHVLRFADPDAARGVPDEMETYESAIATIAARHGARVAGWFAVEGTIIGDGRVWHQVRFNQFPSKRAFLALAADPERQLAQQDHRDKAIADTFTVLVRPVIDLIAESVRF